MQGTRGISKTRSLKTINYDPCYSQGSRLEKLEEFPWEVKTPRIHSGAEAGELVTWEGLVWPQMCSPGSWQEKEGFQKAWPHQGEGGSEANLLTFFCLHAYSMIQLRSFVVFSNF